MATEQRIPGLGNGVLQDILFKSHIHPKRKLATLGDAELGRMYSSVKSTLRDMADRGGRDTEKDLLGPVSYTHLILPLYRFRRLKSLYFSCAEYMLNMSN